MSKRLARDIYRLAMHIEASTMRAADRYIRFEDDAGNHFMVPWDLAEGARWMYSPYTRRRSERDGVFNLKLPKKLEDAFVEASTNKVADKVVQFQDDLGRIFVLPFENVGQSRWAYSPWDRSRARRVKILNLSLGGRVEDVLLGP